jgi:hypothetical protein
MIFTAIVTPTLQQTTDVPKTIRGNGGFGSTGVSAIHTVSTTSPQCHNAAVPSDETDSPPSYDLHLSTNPFDDLLEISVPIRGVHLTLGMQFRACPHRHRLQLYEMAVSTPGSRIPKWRSLLCHTYLINCEQQSIHTEEDLSAAIYHAKQRGVINAKFLFAVDKSHGIHPHEGIPQLYFDQLNVIASHIQAIEKERLHEDPGLVHLMATPTIAPSGEQELHGLNVQPGQNPQQPAPQPTPSRDPMTCPPPPEPPPKGVQQSEQPQFFTLSQLKKRTYWPEWRQSRYKMLNQYHDQGMFSAPQSLPQNAKALQMLWIFSLKMDGSKKARMMCNGNRAKKEPSRSGIHMLMLLMQQVSVFSGL